MMMKRSHIAIGAGLLVLSFGAGFMAGIYTLPILVEVRGNALTEVPAVEPGDRTGTFVRTLPGSDPLHWGEGTVRLGKTQLIFDTDVTLTPGPDYRIYLTKRFADDKPSFLGMKADAVQVASLKTFSGPLSFELPEGVDTDAYDNVLVWCEAFSMFITSAQLD